MSVNVIVKNESSKKIMLGIIEYVLANVTQTANT